MAEKTRTINLGDIGSELENIEEDMHRQNLSRAKTEDMKQNENENSTSNNRFFGLGETAHCRDKTNETSRDRGNSIDTEGQEVFDKIMKQFSNMTSAMAVPVHQVITKFSGKPVDFKAWISDIERYANLVELSTQKMPSVALVTCSGAVADFIRRYLIEQESSENLPSWGDLKKLLKERFGEVLNKRQAQLKLRNLKQKTDESVQMFGERIIQAAEDVYTLDQRQSKKTKDLIEQQLIDTFCNGVMFDYMKMKLIREEPTTLEAAIKVARREQNIRDQISLTLDNSQRSQNPLKLTIDQDDRDIQPIEVDHLRNRLCKICFKKDHSTQNCPKLVDVNAADESDSDTSDSENDLQMLPINKTTKRVKFKENNFRKPQSANRTTMVSI